MREGGEEIVGWCLNRYSHESLHPDLNSKCPIITVMLSALSQRHPDCPLLNVEMRIRVPAPQ
jgi:hypothetical protein